MESNNFINKTEFTVISGDDKVILDCIEFYNKTYRTDFKVERFDYDVVVFATISATIFNYEDIFRLGYMFGHVAADKKQKGEIDW